MRIARIILSILCLSILAGCSTSSPAKKKKQFVVAHRQIAPDPVYNRHRYVNPPYPIAATPPIAGPLIVHDIEISVRNTRLEELAMKLARESDYRAYTAASIANNRVSYTGSGSIDEIAQHISVSQQINVVVDHVNREIRFLAAKPISPEFSEAS